MHLLKWPPPELLIMLFSFPKDPTPPRRGGLKRGNMVSYFTYSDSLFELLSDCKILTSHNGQVLPVQ